MLRGVILVLLGWLALAAPAFAAGPTFPAMSGRVVDAANVIPDDIEGILTIKLETLETQSRRQLVIVTLPDLQGYEISDYGYQLGRAWGVGSKEKSDGVLLIVAPKERKVRIEVGYGLEGVLTDGFSSLIISQEIVPKFKKGDMPGGIEAGADAIIHQLTLPKAEAEALAAQPPPKQDNSFAIAVFVALILGCTLFFLLILWPTRIPRPGSRSYNSAAGAAPVTVWNTSSSSSDWSSSSSSSSDSFSGGGGDFGGGGASGDW
ncbi:TPM domain-containing protein [Novosphingobium sp. G106]|uniref:TPM domain-containing protein n=1 Tax=Novosphingobium sp. G106 TaxID=2849500 RepID=UPI001C2D3456|nr:TPM domain-containing protein [Novosphingobium sp. G106]MBV1688290.1 TPM domain-containing protein [Novosphingobium sp. G106]